MAKSYVYSSTDPSAPPIRGPESALSIGWGMAQNAYNAWQPKWGANTANALVTGILSSLATLSGALVPSRVYELYKEQEQLYIQNADEEARRIRIKGDIELRNLEVAHAISQGKNELAAAASGTNMVTSLSGSSLDLLVQNYKYNTLDERTSSLETLWEIDNAKRQGYINAIQVAGQAMNMAYSARSKSLAALGALIKNTAIPLLKDQQTYITQNANAEMVSNAKTKDWSQFYKKYNDITPGTSASILNLNINPDPATTGAAVQSSSSAEQQNGITSFLMSEQGIPFADPVTGINVHNGDGVSLPLIQLNLDGSVRNDYNPLKIN